MRKIKNAYAKCDNVEYNCFACSPENENGLKMEFWEDGENIISYWTPPKHITGFKNIIHGGIQATVLDEIAAWAVSIKCKTAGVTSNLNAKYRRPVILEDAPFTVKATIKYQKRRLCTVFAAIYDKKDNILVEADITYFLFPVEKAIKEYGYPGYDAFFD